MGYPVTREEKYRTSNIISLLSPYTESSELEDLRSSAPRYANTLSFIDRHLKMKPGDNILDLGTGKGWMATLVKIFFPDYNLVAGDIEIPDNIRTRLAKLEITTVDNCRVSKYDRLPFQDELFNACLFLEVFEHVIEDPLLILRELNRILSKGGLLFFTTPNLANIFNRSMLLMGRQPQLFLTGMRSKYDSPRGHFREWTMDELIYLIRKSDFQPIDKGYMDDVGYEGLVQKRLLLKALYYPYQAVIRMRPSFRSRLAIVAKKI
jgi:ubiquinone/menaquinone biosynthesis C-methylase UbiE